MFFSSLTKLVLFLVIFLAPFQAIPLNAQELADYSKAAHWAGGVNLGGDLGPPLKVGDLILVVDGNGELQAVDVSDPYAPVVQSTITLPEPISGIYGPHEGYLYATGSDFLYVLDEDTFIIEGLIFQTNIDLIVFGDSFGAMLTDDRSRLVLFDQTLPMELPSLGSLSFSYYYSGMKSIVFHGDLPRN